MKDLTKEMHFEENDKTTFGEIEKLANKMLATTWTIDIYRSRIAQDFNLKEKGWKFEFNSRKRAAGVCSRERKTIYLSKYLLEQNLHKSLEFENTIRHELAHAIDIEMRGTSDHSRVWKAIAKAVLCTAERCYTDSEIGDKKSKYTLVCDTCETEQASHKRKKRISACGDCCRNYNGGRYTEKYALRQVQNY